MVLRAKHEAPTVGVGNMVESLVFLVECVLISSSVILETEVKVR